MAGGAGGRPVVRAGSVRRVQLRLHQLTDIIASLVSAAALVGLTRVWAPGQARTLADRERRGHHRPAIAGGSATDVAFERRVSGGDEPPPRGRELLLAFAPYLIIIVVLGAISLIRS